MNIKYCKNGYFKYWIDKNNIQHLSVEVDGTINYIESKNDLSYIFETVDIFKTVNENIAYNQILNYVEEESGETFIDNVEEEFTENDLDKIFSEITKEMNYNKKHTILNKATIKEFEDEN